MPQHPANWQIDLFCYDSDPPTIESFSLEAPEYGPGLTATRWSTLKASLLTMTRSARVAPAPDSDWPKLMARLKALQLELPLDHLERFLGQARAGQVVGIRRPWPEDAAAFGQGCVPAPVGVKGDTLRLSRLVLELTALAQVLGRVAQGTGPALASTHSPESFSPPSDSPTGQAKAPLTLTLACEPLSGKLPSASAKVSPFKQADRLELPIATGFRVASSDPAEMRLIAEWVLAHFAAMLTWPEGPAADGSATVAGSATDTSADQATTAGADTGVSAGTAAAALTTIFNGLLTIEPGNPPDPDLGRRLAKLVSKATADLNKWLTPLPPAGTPVLSAQPTQSSVVASEVSKAATAALADNPPASTQRPQVKPEWAGRLGRWAQLLLDCPATDGANAEAATQVCVQIPLDLLALPDAAASSARTSAGAPGWTEGYHYFGMAALGSEQRSALDISVNVPLGQDLQGPSRTRLFRRIGNAAGTLSGETLATRHQRGALVFSPAAPEWDKDPDRRGRMGIHLLERQAHKRIAAKERLSSDRLKAWQFGRANAVALAGYLAMQAYLHVEHRHKLGMGLKNRTAAWSYLRHEWHEFRMVDALKSLSFTALTGGAGLATFFLGGAPLIIGAVGLGAAALVDPFSSRITDASKLTKRREFDYDGERLRTVRDPAHSASSWDVIKRTVQSANESMAEHGFFEEPPENALTRDGQAPQDDVKDVGKLVRRAYVHLDIVHENMPKLEREWDAATRLALLGESFHHMEKTWRYLAPSIIFASAAFDVFQRIAEQWNNVYPAMEAASITHMHELGPTAFDLEAMATLIVQWFDLEDLSSTAKQAVGLSSTSKAREQILQELSGLRSSYQDVGVPVAVIDPATQAAVHATGDGRFSGGRSGYTTGGKVGATLADCLSHWNYRFDAPIPVQAHEAQIGELDVHIANMNQIAATHLAVWDQLSELTVRPAPSLSDGLRPPSSKGPAPDVKRRVQATPWDAVIGTLADSDQQAIKVARLKASDPSYLTQIQHKWSNWQREKTAGQRKKVYAEKFFGFSLGFAGPMLTQGADRAAKISLTAGSRAFYMAGKKLGKFATTRGGVKSDLKRSGLLNHRAMAHSLLLPSSALDEALQDSDAALNDDLIGADLNPLKGGASFIGTSLIRKIAFRMMLAAEALNALNGNEGAQQKAKVNGSVEDMVDTMKYMYEYHHHMDKLEFYLMGLLTYLSTVSDVAAAHEAQLFELAKHPPIRPAPSLTDALRPR
jgi:hypothetical protein